MQAGEQRRKIVVGLWRQEAEKSVIHIGPQINIVQMHEASHWRKANKLTVRERAN